MAVLRGACDGFVLLSQADAGAIAARVDLSAALLRSMRNDLLALRQVGLAGKVRFVGFDASPPLVEALKSGEIDALVVQNPRKMGYLATKTLVAAIRGEQVEPRVDTGVVVATRANMNEPAIAPLLQ